MRKLVFAKKINGTDETGLIDISKKPPELFCLCDEDKANEILNLNKADVMRSGCDHDWRRMIEITANIDECRKCGIQQSNHLH